MLDLLQYPEFCSALARGQFCRLMDDQILLHWQHYMRKRAFLIAKHVENISMKSSVSNETMTTVTTTTTITTNHNTVSELNTQ